jgi:uroporphyrinogen decarboxylase
LPDLIDAGVEILNPVQTSAYNMDAEFLKETFGNRIVFWGGGVDNSRIFPYGSQTEVRDDVKKRLEVFMVGGGYVFSTIHNIQPDVSAENIIAMWEALQEYGVY